MIKIKELENIQDSQAITIQRLNNLISELQSKSKSNTKIKTNKLLQTAKLKSIHQQQNTHSLFTNASLIQQVKTFDNGKSQNIQIEQCHQLVDLCFSNNRRKKNRQNGANLKQIVSDQKIKLIIRNFINKLKRNNVNSNPVDYTPFGNDMDMSFLDHSGIQLNQLIFIGIAALSVIQIIVLTIIYTLSIVFPEVNKSPLVSAIQSFSLGFYFLQILVNFVAVRFQQGRKIVTFREIWTCYAKDNFPIDFISAVILVIDLFGNFQVTNYFRLFIIVKLFQGLQKIQKLEIFFINNFYNQQYWSLVKVFLFNYCFAHILAIFLVAMAQMDSQQNWMIRKNLENAPWYQKYAWSYYWATTTMLTVGFGDLYATTYKQAIIMVLIQTISVMCLAYNINCIGTLINNIRSQDLQKSKNFKVFRKLARKNNVTQDLQWRINNYIQQSSNIKKKFNHEEQNIFVDKLPKGLRVQFLKQSNKKIFQKLPFFKNLMQRTLFNFAQRIQMHICHPEQILQHIDDRHNLLILKGGSVGFTCKKVGCDFNSTVVDTLQIQNLYDPVLISLGFIRQNRPIYEIKSLQYSIIYYLDQEHIISILRSSQMDYQLYCLLRDKCSHIPDQYQLFKCVLCSGKHTKFSCPKLHYIPFKQHVMNKYLNRFKTGKMKRSKQINRIISTKINSLKNFQYLNLMQNNKSQPQNAQKQQKKLMQELFSIKNQKIQQNNNSLQSFSKFQQMKDYFAKNTAQVIKNQMNKLLLNGQGYDQVWIVQTDKIKNYKNYFEFDNSYNLAKKFLISKRTKRGTINEENLVDVIKRIRTRKLSQIKGMNNPSKDSINSFNALMGGGGAASLM